MILDPSGGRQPLKWKFHLSSYRNTFRGRDLVRPLGTCLRERHFTFPVLKRGISRRTEILKETKSHPYSGGWSIPFIKS